MSGRGRRGATRHHPAAALHGDLPMPVSVRDAILQRLGGHPETSWMHEVSSQPEAARAQPGEKPAAPLARLRRVFAVALDPLSPMGEPEPEDLDCLESFSDNTRTDALTDSVVIMDLREQTRRALATLTRHEEQVLRRRFGIGEPMDHSPDALDSRIAMTGERIRRIEARALRKLRRPSPGGCSGGR